MAWAYPIVACILCLALGVLVTWLAMSALVDEAIAAAQLADERAFERLRCCVKLSQRACQAEVERDAAVMRLGAFTRPVRGERGRFVSARGVASSIPSEPPARGLA